MRPQREEIPTRGELTALPSKQCNMMINQLTRGRVFLAEKRIFPIIANLMKRFMGLRYLA